VASQIDVFQDDVEELGPLRDVSAGDTDHQRTVELQQLWEAWDKNPYRGMRKGERRKEASRDGIKWAGLPRYKPIP
jgi:hypothetical protein